MENQNFEEITDFDEFMNFMENHKSTSYNKSQRSGRNKARYEMHCFWYTPQGAKFTYRSDDTLKRLKSKFPNLNPNSFADELTALQIRFSTIRNKAKQVIIYDNDIEGDNIVFMVKKGETLVNRVIWTPPKPPQSHTAKKSVPQSTQRTVKGNFAARINQLAKNKRV